MIIIFLNILGTPQLGYALERCLLLLHMIYTIYEPAHLSAFKDFLIHTKLLLNSKHNSRH